MSQIFRKNIDSSVYSEFDPFHPFKLHAIVAQFVPKITKIALQTSTNGTSIHSIEMRPFEDDFSRFVLNESWERIAVMTASLPAGVLVPIPNRTVSAKLNYDFSFLFLDFLWIPKHELKCLRHWHFFHVWTVIDLVLFFFIFNVLVSRHHGL